MSCYTNVILVLRTECSCSGNRLNLSDLLFVTDYPADYCAHAQVSIISDVDPTMYNMTFILLNVEKCQPQGNHSVARLRFFNK